MARAARGGLRDAAVLPLIEILPKYPVITAAVAEQDIGRSRPATIAGLARLEEIKALTRHRNQKLGDSWEATALELPVQLRRSRSPGSRAELRSGRSFPAKVTDVRVDPHEAVVDLLVEVVQTLVRPALPGIIITAMILA